MPRTLHLYVFCDALGWEIDRQRPIAPDLMPKRLPLGTIFGYSSTCDPTILTGKLPKEHGHFSCFFYSPKTSPFKGLKWLKMIPSALRERARARRLISRWLRKRLGYTGYFQLYNMPFDVLPLFDYSEKRDIYKPGGILTGLPTIFTLWREAGLKVHVSNWNLPEAQRVAEAKAAVASGEPDCMYLYLADLDAVLHRVGPDVKAAEEMLASYDRTLHELVEAAKAHYGEVSLHLFSDHGMTAVTKTVDIMGKIEATGLRFGKDFVAVYDSTMARFWFLTPESRAKIEKAMAEVKEGRWVSGSELQEFGCDFRDDVYGQAYFLLDPGVLLCPGFMGNKPIAGMHGYDPRDKDSVALYATNDPSGPIPRRLEDLYEVMSVPAIQAMQGATHA